MLHDTFDEDYQPVERLNKTQQKREIQSLLELGKSLSRLDSASLHNLELPAQLRQALLDSKSMKHGALKRQYKLIGKLLRQINTDSLTETISMLEGKKAEQDKSFHRTERWRDRLLANDPRIATQFMAEYPEADIGQIRQLVRNAHKELAANKAPKSSRTLFRLLRDIISN